MKAHLTRRYMFSASHRLHSPQLSDEENRATYGKCNNPHGHGHNYMLEVTVSGQVDEATGMVCNLVDLDGFVQQEILERFDLQNLNMLRGVCRFSPDYGKPEHRYLRNNAAGLQVCSSRKGANRRDHDELVRVFRRRGANDLIFFASFAQGFFALFAVRFLVT